MYLQERNYGFCRSILQLPGIMHGVMGPLFQLYYRQCYFNIIYNQLRNCVHNIGNVLLLQTYFKPYNISCFKAFLQKCFGFGNKFGHVDK